MSDAFRNELISQFFPSATEAYKATPAFERDLEDHLFRRYEHFKNDVAPWIFRHVERRGHIVEVGSGTGSSTAALAPYVEKITSYELDEKATCVAGARLRDMNIKNARFAPSGYFSASSHPEGSIDGVFLAAVLEHCSLDECLSILRDAWAVLAPGGWLCVIDTPNRLTVTDHHTSLLPFFHMLPAGLRLAYAVHSPREGFRQDMANAPDKLMSLTRWGCGISYHEFELAISQGVHQYVVADGWEPEIVRSIGVTVDDTTLLNQVAVFAPSVHRAFARRALYLILQKPA